MRRNFSFFHGVLVGAVFLALWIPASALAVGLGKLTVFSGLGQPLNAEIDLVSNEKNELDSLSVRVAPPTSYRDAKVEYQSVLTRVKLVVDRRKDGTPILKISSTQPVNDPFLDLLLEVSWASGRLTREYTFLLDPPEFGNKSVAIESAAPVHGQALPAAAAPASQKPATAPQTAAAQTGTGDTYGPVKRGDTLNKIATQTKPEGVTLDQMLIALYQANKGAFIGNNIHRLRTGETLSVPGKDEAAAIAETDAAKQVRMQTADWRAYRERIAANAPSTPEEAGGASAGKITTRAEDTSAPAQAGRDQLRLSKAQAGAKGAAASAAVREDATAREKALTEANSRVADLEKQVKDLQQLITLKNQALHDLQQQAQQAKAPAALPQSEAKVAQQAPAPQTVPPVEAPKPQAATPAAAVAPAPAAAAPEIKPEVPAPAAPTVVAKAADSKPRVAAAPPPPQDTSLVDDLLGNPLLLAGGGGVVALAGIWALLTTRRKRATRGFEDSIMAGTDIKTNTVFGNTGGGVVNTGDNSLVTGFSRQGLGNIDTDEVDPIAEAEVYLAYGRDAQAEEILRDALQKDPQRHEIYLKLLEIQAHNNRRDAFEAIAGDLYAVTKGEGEIWQRAAAMGRGLDPNNPMFAEGAEHAGGSETSPLSPTEPNALEMGSVDTQPLSPLTVDETQVFTIRPALTPEPAKPAATSLDFNLDELSTRPGLELPPLPEAEPEVPKDGNLMEWEAPKLSAVPSSTPARDPKASNESWEATVEERKEPPRAAPVLTTVESSKVTPLHEAKTAVTGLDLDKLDLSFDPQRAPMDDPTPSVLDGQWHDAATKLDLARAYQEMGDLEGAREILQEVLHEGDADQKKEAQTLLDKLRAA